MFRSIPTRPWFRRALAAAAFSAVLVGSGAQAHAFDLPWWWPFQPRVSYAAPEIDAGLASSAAAILVGGLLVRPVNVILPETVLDGLSTTLSWGPA